MRRVTFCLVLITVSLLSSSCAFHKKADEWSSLVGPDGNRVYLNSTTKVGLNFLIFFTFIGETDIQGMVAEATGQIREEGGNYVRVVQSNSENYWHAVPPFTFIITPVVHSLIAEYRPRWEVEGLQPLGPVGVAPDFSGERTYQWRRNGY